MINTILFDLDGVLIDARDWHYEALNQALALFGFHISRYEHLTTYNGLPTRKKLEMLSVEKGMPHGLHDIINTVKQKLTKEIIVQKCRPTFAHEFALAQLRKEGYKLGVCTNSVRASLDMMLGLSHLSDYFDVTLSWEECARPKPDPAIYTTALEKLGVRPSDTVIIEDAEDGIKAAEASQAHVLAVIGPIDVTYENIKAFIQRIDTET